MCEGVVTEPQYVRGLARWAANATIEIVIPSDQGDPKTLVEIAKGYKTAAQRSAKRERDRFLLFDEIWCVCDVDEHSRLPDARQMARDNSIELAVSNSCFELWLLLHFRESPGAQDRVSLRRLVKTYIADYDKHVDFSALEDGVIDAISRAKKLHELAVQDGEEGRNPTTGVFRLAEAVLTEA